MSISSIQGLTGYDYSLDQYTSSKKQKTASTSSRNTGPDTVSLSEEALSLMQKQEKSSSQEEDSDQQLETINIETRKKASQKASKKTSFDMFSFLLESLFLAELSNSEEATTQTEGDGSSNDTSKDQSKDIPAQTKTNSKTSSSLQGKNGVEEIKNTLVNLSKGKASIQDILHAALNASKTGKIIESKSIASSKNSDSDNASLSHSL